jgi:hypothetical protein
LTGEPIFESDRLELAGVINTLLDKGVVLRADAILSVADIDLVTLDLGVLLVAVETALRQKRGPSLMAGALGGLDLSPQRAEAVRSGAVQLPAARPPAREEAADIRELAPALPDRINVDPANVESGLARLVLTLIEVLRKVLEHQAIRRMEGGTLTEDEIERLGLGLLRLHERMQELKGVFGLTDEDLEIDLGPLGRLR